MKIKTNMKYILRHPFKSAGIALASIPFLTGIAQAQSNPMDAHLHGKVRSGQTAQGLPGVEVKYKQLTPTIDSIITYTNQYGEYNFNITGVKEPENNETIGEIKYYWNKIELPTDGKIIVYDILGRKILQKNGQRGVNQLNELDKLADQIFIEQIEINGKTEINKLLKTTEKGKATYSQGNKPGKINTSKKSLNKITDDITYTLDFRDTTGQHYTYLVLDTKTLTQDQEFNTPMIPKGLVEIQFTDPISGRNITNIKEFLLYLIGAYQLPAIAYGTTEKKIKTHLDLEDLPTQYNPQDIRDATLEMMAATGLPIDSIYEETATYIDPQTVQESTVGYQYVESGVLQGYDFGITFLIDAQTHKTSYIFQFNKETIEPQYIKKFVKLAWFGGTTRGLPPVQGYFSSDGRNGIDTMLTTEKYVWRTDFEWSDKPTFLSIYNFPDDSSSGPMRMNKKLFDKYVGSKPEFMKSQDRSYEQRFKMVNGRMQETRTPITDEERRAIYKKK